MNIVKLKDIILDPETSGLTQEQCDLFNEKFRGRYVHCIDWTYLMPLEEMNGHQAINLSRGLVGFGPIYHGGELVENYSHLLYDDFLDYVDLEITTKINDISKYIAFNNFVPEELTLDMIKKFRTWLASTILGFEQIEDADINHMLNYYANGMMDDVVKGLMSFGNTQLALTTERQPSCGCNGNSGVSQTVIASTVKSSSCGCQSGNLSSLYLQGLSQCDPLMVYRKNIYLKMIEVFVNIDFWMQFDPDFLVMFKAYVDGIIKANLDLVKSTFTTDFVDCGCVNDSSAAQLRQIVRLKNLSTSLSYMINDQITGHKNSITTSLIEFTTYIYEIAEW